MTRPSEPAVRDCPGCEREWDHCHGTLIVHTDGAVECTEDDCSASPHLHAWTTPCGRLVPACECAGTGE
ncbi:hypothetical protein HDA32_003213 [Spinactinospora alkalitolerans]|uniref:Uncharacterized protein n=1 Tax=Spinactinospora alkalitolerans TaxID=687207 RepID=A0A852TZ82_9ACTN|nr:hypothetical protein [Spinactinospora alkalitolerans]NYE48093.1 hypothetical protein [Spinactinospora alkalitolerans]